MPTRGFCESGEVLGKTTHKLGVERISKSFFRALFSNKRSRLSLYLMKWPDTVGEFEVRYPSTFIIMQTLSNHHPVRRDCILQY